MSKTLKPVPEFTTEAEERKFWEAHDSTQYVDWSKAQWVRFPNLKPSTTSIRDVPYQSLIKTWLAEKIERS